MSSRLCKILQICEDSERLNDEDGSMLLRYIAREMNPLDRKKAMSQMLLAMKSQISNKSLDEILAFKKERKLVPQSNNSTVKSTDTTPKQDEKRSCAQKQQKKDMEMKHDMKSMTTKMANDEKSAAENGKCTDKADVGEKNSPVLTAVNRLTFLPQAIFQHIAKFVEKKQWLRLSLCNHQSYYSIHDRSFFNPSMKHTMCWHQNIKTDENSRGIWRLNSYDMPDIIKNPSKYKHRESTNILYLRPHVYGDLSCVNNKCNLSKLIDACKKDEQLKWFLRMLSKIESLRISCRWKCAYKHIPFEWLLLRDHDYDNYNDDSKYPYPLKLICTADIGVNPSPLDNDGVANICKQFNKYYKTCTQKAHEQKPAVNDGVDKDMVIKNVNSFKIRPIHEIYYPLSPVKCNLGFATTSMTEKLLKSKLLQYMNTAYLFIHARRYSAFDNYQAALKFASVKQFCRMFHRRTDTLVLEIHDFSKGATDYYGRWQRRKFPFAKFFFASEKIIQYFHERCKPAAIEVDHDHDQTAEDKKNELKQNKNDETKIIAQEMENVKEWLNIKKLKIRCKDSCGMIFFRCFINDLDHRKLWNFFNFTNTVETLELKLNSTAYITNSLNSLISALSRLIDLKIIFVFSDFKQSQFETVRKMTPFFENNFDDVLNTYFDDNDQIKNQMTSIVKSRTLTLQWRDYEHIHQQYHCTFIIYRDEQDNQDIYNGFKGKYVTIEQACHEGAVIASSNEYQNIQFGFGCQKCLKYQLQSTT